MIKQGDILKVVFTQNLPKKDVAPPLKTDMEYKCAEVFLDSKGNPHIDVGLSMDVETITSFATGEKLPSGKRWCHPNRFVIINP